MPRKMNSINTSGADLDDEDLTKLHSKVGALVAQSATSAGQVTSELPILESFDDRSTKSSKRHQTKKESIVVSDIANFTQLEAVESPKIKHEVTQIELNDLIMQINDKFSEELARNQDLSRQHYESAIGEVRERQKVTSEEISAIKKLLEGILSHPKSAPEPPEGPVLVDSFNSSTGLREKSVSKVIRFPPSLMRRIAQLSSKLKLNASAIIKYAVNMLYEREYGENIKSFKDRKI